MRYLYSMLGLLTAFALVIILFHRSDGKPINSADFWMAIVEILVVIIIFILGESISQNEKKTLQKSYTNVINSRDNEINILKEECVNIKGNVSFVSNFEDYCKECKDAIIVAENNSQIFTIQTPIFLETDNSAFSGYYKDYITETASQLLVKNSVTDSAKISAYRRLIVINDKSDMKEIEEEKNKLKVFVETLYSQLNNWNNQWKPTLLNIHIGIIKAEDIFNSPFSNLDILLIKNTHLVIAFPLENNNSYIWGTSLHLNNGKGYLDKFSAQVPKFEQIYQKVWDSSKIKKIDFGKIHKSGNLDSSKAAILDSVEDSFTSLLSS